MGMTDQSANPGKGPFKLGERTVSFHMIGETRFRADVVEEALRRNGSIAELAETISRGLKTSLKGDAETFQDRIFQTIREMGGTVEVHVETAIRFVRPK